MIELIEQSDFATWIRESPSLLGYTLLLALHAIGLAIVVGLNTVVALRILGIAPEIPLAPARKFFSLMYAGFWINALSGLALFTTNASSFLSNEAFLIKFAFIALAVLNLRLIKHHIFDEDGLPLADVATTKARTFAVASLAFWGGAIIAGRLTAYPYLLDYYFG